MAEFTGTALPAQEVTGFICFGSPTAKLTSFFLVKTALKVVCLKLVNKAVTDPAFSNFTYKTNRVSNCKFKSFNVCIIDWKSHSIC